MDDGLKRAHTAKALYFNCVFARRNLAVACVISLAVAIGRCDVRRDLQETISYVPLRSWYERRGVGRHADDLLRALWVHASSALVEHSVRSDARLF